jgi:hypothetical protein
MYEETCQIADRVGGSDAEEAARTIQNTKRDGIRDLVAPALSAHALSASGPALFRMTAA